MSSPIRKTRGSRGISSRRPSDIACRYVFVANLSSQFISTVVRCVQLVGFSVDAGDGLRRIRLRALVGPLHGLVQQPLDLDDDLVVCLLGQHIFLLQPASVALDLILSSA